MAEQGLTPAELMEYLAAKARDAGREVNAAPPAVHVARGALTALCRLRLLSEDETAMWHERLYDDAKRFTEIEQDESQHPAPAWPVRPPDVDGMTVGDVLERQVVAIDHRRQTEAMHGRKLAPWNNPERDAGQVLLQALVDLGLVSELDERRWQERITRAADPGAEPLRIYSAGSLRASRAEVRPAIPERRTGLDEPLVHPQPVCSFEELLDVIVLRTPAESHVRVSFIERYSDGFAVNWSEPPIERPQRHLSPFRRLEAFDDLGTHYFSAGGRGGGGGPHRSTYNYAFAPAIPPNATELRLTINDEGFSITLPGAP